MNVLYAFPILGPLLDKDPFNFYGSIFRLGRVVLLGLLLYKRERYAPQLVIGDLAISTIKTINYGDYLKNRTPNQMAANAFFEQNERSETPLYEPKSFFEEIFYFYRPKKLTSKKDIHKEHPPKMSY